MRYVLLHPLERCNLIEKGVPQAEIQEKAYQYQQEIEAGRRKIVGVNTLQLEESVSERRARRTLKISPKMEADQIRKTADDTIAAEKAYQAGYKKITDAEKKASEARIADMNKSKASMDAALKQAEPVVPTLDDEIKKIQKEYDDALDALLAKVKDKVAK